MKSLIALILLFCFHGSAFAFSISSAFVSRVSVHARLKEIGPIAQAGIKSEYYQSVQLFKSGKFTEAIASFGRLIANPSTPIRYKNKALIGRSQAL